MIASNPQGAILAEGPMEKVAILNGFKEFPEVFGTFKEKFQALQQQQQMQAQMQMQAQAAQKMATGQQQAEVSHNAQSA